MSNLNVVDIDELEILAVGTWKGYPSEKTFTLKDLQNMATAFDELSAITNYEPPVKLGHDKGQKLLQVDGYPAAGWVRTLKVKGEKLVASLGQVPQKIGEIVKVGGWRKVSSETLENYEEGGKTYPLVLRAISLLGNDIPAVKTIADIQAQYSQGEVCPQITIYEMAEGAGVPKTDLERVMAHHGVTEEEAKKMMAAKPIEELLPPRGTKVGSLDEAMNSLNAWAIGPELATKSAASNSEIKAYLQEVRAKLKALSTKTENNQNTEEVDDMNGVREMLALNADASETDVLEAIRKLKSAPESVTLAEHTQVSDQVKSLTQKLAERDRDDAVGSAIKQGKIMPAQKEWADAYALSDAAGFATFVAGAPVAVKLSAERGGNTAPAVELTEQEIAQGKYLGITEEELIAFKTESEEVG